MPSGLAAPIQWWTDSRTTNVSSSGVAQCPSAYDIDNGYIHGSNVIVLPHDSEYLGDNSSYAYSTCTGAWGFGPNFYDTVTRVKFHLNHIRPGSPLASLPVGTMLKAGSFVGLSGGDTCETGYCSNGYPYGGCLVCNGNGGAGTCPLEGGGTGTCHTAHSCAPSSSAAAHFCVVQDPSTIPGSFCPTSSTLNCGAGQIPTCATVNVQVYAGAGTVSVSGNGKPLGSTTSSQMFAFDIGDSYSFQATPSPGNTFVKFCGDEPACSLNSTSNPLTGTITAASGYVYAIFNGGCTPNCGGGCGTADGCGGTCGCPHDNTDQYATNCMASGAYSACSASRSYDGYVEERASYNCGTRWSRYTCNYPPCNGTVRVDRNSPYFVGNALNYSFSGAGSTYSSQIDHGTTYCVAWSYNSPWAPNTIGCSN